jgi:phage terminase small subunit
MKIIVADKVVELTDEQLELFAKLKTKLQKDVALNSLQGMTDVDSYVKGGGKAVGENSISTSASEIINNPNLVAFKESFNGHLVSEAIMGREEMLERLTLMARTEITDVIKFSEATTVETEVDGEKMVDEQSTWSLRESEDMRNGGITAISEVTASRDGLKIKLHDQKAAMKQIADIEGFNAAIKQDLLSSDRSMSPANAVLTKDQAVELLKKNGMADTE